MARKSQSFGGEEIREESSWSYPLGIFVATLILSGVFLYYYFGPRLDDIAGAEPKPTISEEQISIQIAGETFQIPANYTVYPRARRGGERQSVILYTLSSDFIAYTPSRRELFVKNDPDTTRIDIIVAARTQLFNEQQRLENLYLPLTIDETGGEYDYDLRRYTFQNSRPDSPMNGYRDEELFVGALEDGTTAVLRCFKDMPNIPSPDCRREYEMNDNLSVTYHFKRPYLADWREIDAGVKTLLERFHQSG